MRAWIFIAFIGLMALAAGIHDTRKQIPSKPEPKPSQPTIVISSPLPNRNQYLAQQPGVAATEGPNPSVTGIFELPDLPGTGS